MYIEGNDWTDWDYATGTWLPGKGANPHYSPTGLLGSAQQCKL